MKRVYRDKPLVSKQPGAKSAYGPADEPLINQSSTARRVPRFDLHGISLVRAFEETSRMVVFGALEIEIDDCPLGASSRLAPPHPAPRPASRGSGSPRRPAVPRSEPLRPWYVRVLHLIQQVT